MNGNNRVVPTQPPRQVLLQQQQQQQHELQQLGTGVGRGGGLGVGEYGDSHSADTLGYHRRRSARDTGIFDETQDEDVIQPGLRALSPLKPISALREEHGQHGPLKRSTSLVNKLETQPFIREKTPSAKAFKKIVDGQPTVQEDREGHPHLTATASAFAIVSSHLTRGLGGKGFESLQTATSLLAQIRIQENKAGILAQYIFGFSMVGVLLMVLQNELIYAHRIAGITDTCIGCEVVKGIITITTLISVSMLPRLYEIFCKLLKLENMLPMEAKWYNTWLLKQFICELVILLLHFPPFVSVPHNVVAEFDNRPVTEISTELLSLIMSLRLYQFPRILLYRSRYFRESKFLGAMTDIQVSTSFILRVHAYENPMTSLGVFASGMLLFCSYSIFLCERYLVKDWFFSTSVWFTSITMTTVGYGNDEVHTHLGRGFSVLAAVAGTVATSLIIVAVNNRMSLTQKEIKVVSLVSKTRFRQRIMHVASIFIQRAWKYHQHRNDPNANRNNLWYFKRRVYSALKMWRKIKRQSVTSSAIFQESISSSRIEDIFHRVRTIEEQLEQILDPEDADEMADIDRMFQRRQPSSGGGAGSHRPSIITDDLAQDLEDMHGATTTETTTTTDSTTEETEEGTSSNPSTPKKKKQQQSSTYVDLTVKVDSIATAIDELNARMAQTKNGKLVQSNSASTLSFEDSMKNRMNNLQEKLVHVSSVLEATQQQQRQLQEWQVAWQQQFQQQLEAINALQSLLRQQVDTLPQGSMTIPQLQPQSQTQTQSQTQSLPPVPTTPRNHTADHSSAVSESTTSSSSSSSSSSSPSTPVAIQQVDKVIELTQTDSPRRSSSSTVLSPLKSKASTSTSQPLPSLSNTESQSNVH